MSPEAEFAPAPGGSGSVATSLLLELAPMYFGVALVGLEVAGRLGFDSTAVLAKEGVAEALSALLLAAAIGVLLRGVPFRSPGAAWGRWAGAAYCGLLLGEELDWGGVLGFGWSLRLHEGHAYSLFAIPLLVFWMLAFRMPASSKQRVGGLALPKRRALGVLILCLGSLVALSLTVLSAWEEPIEELTEAMLAMHLFVQAANPALDDPGKARQTEASS